MAVTGLNRVGSVGVGKYARIVKAKARVAKLFAAGGSLGCWGVVLAWVLLREGAAASEGAMVVGGIGHRST